MDFPFTAPRRRIVTLRRLGAVLAGALAGVALAAPAADDGLAGLRFEPESIAFDAPQKAGTQSASRVLVLRPDPAASNPASYELRAVGDFVLSATRCELAAQGACAVGVSFAPTRDGNTTGAVVVADAKGGPTRVAARLSGQGVSVCAAKDPFGCADKPELVPVVVLVLLYGLAMLTARWNLVARPAQRLLDAEIGAVQTRLDALTQPPRVSPAGAAQVDELLKRARKLLQSEDLYFPLLDSVFWTRGQEHAAWQLVHEAKEQMSLLLPPAELRVALEDVEVQLRQAGDAQALALAERIRAALSAAGTSERVASDRAAALLREARNQLYDSTDNEFASIACWHKKTSWMIGVSLILVVALTAALGHAVFFLVGALGGLLSRLSRALGSQKLPTDYGLSWTTLFLSPMVGALAGWAGLLLMSLAVKLEVLGKMFAFASWGETYNELALGLALVFGFSERIFVTIVSGVESKLAVTGSVAGGPPAPPGGGGGAGPTPTPAPSSPPGASPSPKPSPAPSASPSPSKAPAATATPAPTGP